MNSLFLTADELIGLTGYEKPSYQIAWLRKQGFTFRVAIDGRPRVDRSHYRCVMGGSTSTAQRVKTEPDFTGLMKLA